MISRAISWHSPKVTMTPSWLFVTFGENQAMAQLIAKKVFISPLIHKDFPVRYPLLARGNLLP